MTAPKNLEDKEHIIQKALGTLPMKMFTLSQPLKLLLNLELVIDIEAVDQKDAIKEFKAIIDDPAKYIWHVEELLRMLIEKYSIYRDKNNVIIPRAIAEARANLQDNEILIIREKT